MKILLLQTRNPNDPAKTEEVEAFANKAHLPLETFVPFDLLAGPPPLSQLRNHDALMIGGSGEYSVPHKSLPHLQETLDLLAEVVELGFPTFASCFGFQLMVAALGGDIISDKPNMEVGAYDVTLTEAGRSDELFGHLPDTFLAQFGHKDRATSLPRSFVNLAHTDYCPFQALRIPGKAIWATQFHPELTGEENLMRYSRYLKDYDAIMTREQREQALARFVPSPDTHDLIPRFLTLIGS